MNLWLVNPFDPLPGDPEQEGRYATLARFLRARGHAVTWWTSAFSHRFKRPVPREPIERACGELGIEVRFLPAPAYRRNVSLARAWNHFLLARRFARQAAREGRRPDVILASQPTPGLAWQSARLKQRWGCRLIVDVQDLWPETFQRLAPGWLKAPAAAALRPMARAARRAYASADAIVGVADAYVERAVALARTSPITATIPLGIDLAAFDAAAAAGACPQFTKPPGEVWLAYSGSLNRSYDPLTVIQAVARLKGAGPPIRLFVTGRGELREKAEEIVAREGLTNVLLPGFLDFPQWAFLLRQCDVGFNSSFPEALVYLPNKVFYYLAAGVAVLNTIPGQCSRIMREAGCGADYQAGDAAGCAAAIEGLLRDAGALGAMRRSARHLAEKVYDRSRLMPGYVELIQRVVGEGPAMRSMKPPAEAGG